jgi:isopentenyl-diphosphate delta-isomerase type 1
MEYFDIVDEDDNVIGKATRKECHTNPRLIHRGADIFIFNSKGQILLQKRSMKKDLYPGMWSFSATGHNDIGESYEDAAAREVMEELGIKLKLEFFCNYKIRSEVESENCKLFTGIHDGPFHPNKEEVDEVKFFDIGEVKRMIAEKGNITPGFTMAFSNYLKSLEEKAKP